MIKDVKLGKILSRARALLDNKKYLIPLVVLFYVFFIVFYMGPSILDCRNSVAGLGDNTGGPIWKLSLKPSQGLLGSPSSSTNYPVGEDLYSPVNYSSIGQTGMLRAADSVVGPICAYNTFNFIGYLSTALIMFCFILYLTRRKSIALLAGYAVAFSPYVQTKIGGHPSYGYGGVLVAALWLALLIIKKTRIRYGLGLGAVLAFCAYFDPYFILLSATIVGPVFGVWAILQIKDIVQKKSTFKQSLPVLKMFALAFTTLLILIAPLIYIRVSKAAAIRGTTTAARGNVRAAAMKCSNLPLDYVLPDPTNIYLMKIYGTGYMTKNINLRHWCGSGESRVSISITILAVLLLSVVILAWERVQKRKLNLGKAVSLDPRLTLLVLLAIVVCAFLLALPPRAYGLRTPTALILRLTDMWRIFAREYVVLNIGLVVLFSSMLSWFASKMQRVNKTLSVVAFICISLAIFAEYQVYTPFSPFIFSYSRDVPATYRIIKDNQDINALAEYPLDRMGIEADSIVYYSTMQTVHNKPIFNSALPTDKREKIHIAMKDLSDPQTIPALRQEGIRYITIHGYSPEDILSRTNQLDIIHVETPKVYGLSIFRGGSSNTIVLAKIKDGPKTDSVTVVDSGLVVNFDLMKSPINAQFEVLNNSVLKSVPLSGAKASPKANMCFDVKLNSLSSQDTDTVEIYVGGEVVGRVLVNATDYTRVFINLGQQDSARLLNATKKDMVIENPGCQS